MTGLRALWSVWAASLVLLIGVTFASAVQAQHPQQTALARTLFEEGVKLADRGDWVGAADRFGRAYSLKPTSGIAFNWASALLETGKLLQAQELLLSVARDESAGAELKRQSESRLRELRPRIARLHVHVVEARGSARERGDDASDQHTQVDVDGGSWPRAAWDVSSPIDPGPHTIVLKRGTAELSRVSLSLAEGESRALVLEPQPAATEHGAEAEVGSGPSERPLYKSWMVWSAVGAAVAGGAIAAIVIATRKDPAREDPVMGNASPGVIRW